MINLIQVKTAEEAIEMLEKKTNLLYEEHAKLFMHGLNLSSFNQWGRFASCTRGNAYLAKALIRVVAATSYERGRAAGHEFDGEFHAVISTL